MSGYNFATHNVVKPITAGIVSYLGDVYILGETDTMRSATFAGTVTAATAVATLTEPTFSNTFAPAQGFTIGKSLAGRAYEVGLSASSVFLINKYVTLNDPFTSPATRMGIIVLGDLVAETVVSLMNLTA